MAIFTGGTGNDTITGSTAADIFIGGDGNDTYIISDTQDTIIDTNGSNTIKLNSAFTGSSLSLQEIAAYNYSGANITKVDATAVTSAKKALTLKGNATSSTTIIGGAGNDTITGGTAADVLTGGAGNDTYIISDTNDTIVEIADGGTDTIKIIDPLADIDLTLYANIENVDASGISFNAKINGNILANTITGGIKNDTLYGGNDTVSDNLIGGNGSDTYIIKDAVDIITETGTDIGDIDTVKLAVNFSPILYALVNTKIEKLDGSSLTKNITLTGNTATATTITGGSCNDTITGGTAVDALIGGAGNDVLYGGNDTLSDNLQGGIDDDTYIIQDTKDIITDVNGSNTIKMNSAFTGSSLSLQETVAYNYSAANITMINASAIISITKALTLTGNATTATTIIGGSGNDTITGGTAADSLTGGAGNDILDGGIDALNDTLTGGAGNDTYIIQDTNDTIVEVASGGTDTIKLRAGSAFLSFDLANIKYTNIDNIDASALSKSVILKGNSLANNLIGTSASDIIYGGLGADNLVGGKGSDLYYVSNSVNTVVEKANEGYDKVVLISNFNSSSFSLSSNIEFLDATAVTKAMTLTGSATIGTAIWGTNYNDVIKGGSADDIIMGFSGDDNISGGAGIDNLDGGVGTDVISGGAGDDYLYGGDDTISDNLIGGDGQDEYYLRDTKDKITDSSGGNIIRLKDIYSDTEFSLAKNATANDGKNYDYSAVDITLLDATKAGHGLILRGSDQSITTTTTTTTTIPATSTTPASTKTTTTTSTSYKNIEIQGTYYNDTIISYGGDDELWGGFYVGDEKHYGYGADIFYGGAGSNKFLGGMGDDIYLVDGKAANTTITELTDDTEKGLVYGNDTIKLISTPTNGAFNLTRIGNTGKLNGLDSFSITLSDNVENLDGSLITGTNLTLTGNSIDNVIKGGSGNDIITGGSKNNILYGNDGNDTINGSAGNDSLSGNDTLYGGEGDDVLYGNTGINILDGGNGDDTYKVSVADEESLEGNAWSDDTPGAIPEFKTTLIDNYGIDTIVLTGKSSYSDKVQEKFSITLSDDIENLDASAISKDLSLIIQGNALDNIITGGTGRDTIDTGDGDDTVYDYAEYIEASGTRWYTGNTIDVGNGNNTVITGKGSDIIRAGDGDDFVYDVGGWNTIRVGNGNNRVYAGVGNDDIIAGTGNDYIIGGDGNDDIDAGDGTNTIIGGAGNDDLTGGTGDDTYIFSKANGNDFITDSAGNNLVKFDSSVNKNEIAVYKDSFDNLYIDYGSTAGRETITAFNSTTEKIQLDNGTFLTNNDINRIIQDMTVFAATNGIQLNDIGDVKNNINLINLVATSWHL